MIEPASVLCTDVPIGKLVVSVIIMLLATVWMTWTLTRYGQFGVKRWEHKIGTYALKVLGEDWCDVAERWDTVAWNTHAAQFMAWCDE